IIEGLLGGGDGSRHVIGARPKVAVVVAYVITTPIRVRTEGVVEGGDEPRFAFSSFGPPRLLCEVEQSAHLLGVAYAPAYEPISPSAHPLYRDWRVAADQQLGTSRLCRGWSYRSDLVAYRLARPDALHELKLPLEPATPVMEGGRGELEVVFSGPDTEPQGEATSGQRVDGCRLLRQHARTSQWSEQHRGHQAPAAGHRRSGRQRDSRLVVRVDQPVGDAEAGEGTGICPLGPVQHERTTRPRYRCWQPYADIHRPSLLE